MNSLRKLKRAVAHENMKKAGLTRVNKKNVVSYFAENWRDYVRR